MADFDTLAPNYRRAKERWPDALTLSESYEALRACFDGNAHGLVEHVKSFIECVCWTILEEFNEPMQSSTPPTTELLVAALKPLGLQNTRGASKLDKVLSGFNKLTDALTEMRNDHGAVAHGKEAFLDAVTTDHARAFLYTGDAVVGVLLNALEGKEPDLTFTREPWDRFRHLNDRIDRAVGVEARVDNDDDCPIVVFEISTGPNDEAIEIRVEPSRLLYGVDRSAYIEVLKTSAAIVAEADAEKGRKALEVAESPALSRAAAIAPLAAVIPSYGGRLAHLRPALAEFMKAEGWPLAKPSGSGGDLIDSLLATADQNMGLDWKQRESLQSRMKVAFKRVLVRFGFAINKAEESAERLVAWMRTHAPDTGEDHREAG